MLFQPNEKGQGLLEFIIIVPIVLLFLARVFCFWPFNNDACRSIPF